MKVLYCITRSDTVGGAHVHVADMAAYLMSGGHRSAVVVGGDGVYTRVLEERGIPVLRSRFLVRPISPVEDARAVRELRSIFREFDPDVLSLHSAKAGVLGRLASARGGWPVLFTAHGWSFTEGVGAQRRLLYRWLERFMAPFADRIICVSEYDRQLALKGGVGSSSQLQTIHNGMPDSSMRASPGNAEKPVRLICVARLDAQKDHHTLFHALTQLTSPEWQLDLVGDGPFEDRLRILAKDLGIDRRVRFLGLRSDVETLLSSSHIFLLPSNWEGFPRSILEAMRAGLPVIASDVGGVSESVDEGHTGFLVPRGDRTRFMQRIDRLMRCPEERQRLGREGRLNFEQHFRFDRMASETVEAYEKLAGAKQ